MLAPFSEVWTYSTRCRRASSASGPNARIVRSNRMSSVASVRMSRLLVFEGVLGRIHHQSENQRRHHDEEIGHPPDHPACIALQVLGGQPRLAEEPKKSRAHHGQEGEYSYDKFAQFFSPSMSPALCDAATSVA